MCCASLCVATIIHSTNLVLEYTCSKFYLQYRTYERSHYCHVWSLVSRSALRFDLLAGGALAIRGALITSAKTKALVCGSTAATVSSKLVLNDTTFDAHGALFGGAVFASCTDVFVARGSFDGGNAVNGGAVYVVEEEEKVI